MGGALFLNGSNDILNVIPVIISFLMKQDIKQLLGNEI